MLASFNTNLPVYIEPNEKTWEVLRKHHAIGFQTAEELDKFIEEYKKTRVFPVTVHGETLNLIEMQLWDFMNAFGDYMVLGNPNVMFVANRVFFSLDDMCPGYDSQPVLEKTTTHDLCPESIVVLPTNCADGDTVRVKFVEHDSSNLLAYWGLPDAPNTFWPKEEILDGEQDYIIKSGRNAIILSNTGEKTTRCEICYAPYKKELK